MEGRISWTLIKTYTNGTTYSVIMGLKDDWGKKIKQINEEDREAGLAGTWTYEKRG